MAAALLWPRAAAAATVPAGRHRVACGCTHAARRHASSTRVRIRAAPLASTPCRCCAPRQPHRHATRLHAGGAARRRFGEATAPPQVRHRHTVLWCDVQGHVPYPEMWRVQQALVAQRVAVASRMASASPSPSASRATSADPDAAVNAAPPDIVLALEHSDVYTLGRGAKEKHLRFPYDPDDPSVGEAERGGPHVRVHRVERGGQVTYHGPGQLVVYPILNLAQQVAMRPTVEPLPSPSRSSGSDWAVSALLDAACNVSDSIAGTGARQAAVAPAAGTRPEPPLRADLHWYVRGIEEVVIRVAASYGLTAERVEGLTGVWVGDTKIGAVGMACSKWITYHGLSINVAPDMAAFDRIVPCGIEDRGVCCVRDMVDVAAHGGVTMDGARQRAASAFSDVFDVDVVRISVDLEDLLCRI